MTASLTPALAVDFVTALSADIRAAAVLDARGDPLAGPAGLAEAARALAGATRGARGGDAAAVGGAGFLEGAEARGKVFVARDERHVIVVVTGPFALARVTRHDLSTALSALGGQNAPIGAPGRLDEARTSALLSAL
jgi:hypothetical protein